jgi:chorismate mutase
MTISDLRMIIDELDSRLLQILNERARVSRQIGLIKRQQGLSIVDNEREAKVLANIVGENTGPLTENQVRALFEKIIASCRELQE